MRQKILAVILQRLPLPSSDLFHRVARAAGWGLIASICARALGLIGSVLVARILGRESLGHYGVVISTTNLFSISAGVGMGATATKYVSQHHRDDLRLAAQLLASSFWLAVACSAASGLGLALGASWISNHLLNSTELATPLRFSAILVFMAGVNGVQVGALAGFESFRSIAKINLTAGLLGMPTLVLLSKEFGVLGAVVGTGATSLISLLLNAAALKKRISGMYSLSERHHWSKVLSFGIPVLISGLLTTPAAWATNAILVNQPLGFSQMGLINVTEQWKMLINYLPLTLSTSLIPVLNSVRSESPRRAEKIALYQVGLSAAIAASVAVPTALLAPLIVRLYGNGFAGAAPLLALTALGTILLAIANATSNSLQALGRPWLELSCHAAWAIVLIASAALLVPRYGAFGYVYAGLVSIFIQVCWQTTLALTTLRPSKHDANAARAEKPAAVSS